MATFAEITSVFECAATADVRLLETENTSVLAFAAGVWAFERKVGHDATDAYWQNFLRPLKRCRFDMLAAPVPPDADFFKRGALSTRLASHIASCDELYPAHCGAARRLLDQLRGVRAAPGSPAAVIAEDMRTADAEQELALVLANSRLVLPTQQYFDAFQADSDCVTAVHYSELTEPIIWDRLYIVGRAWWFPRWVFTSPRSRDLVIVSYAGLDAERLRNDGPHFSRAGLGRPLLPLTVRRASSQDACPPPEYPAFDLDNLKPIVDWDGLASAVGDRRSRSSQEENVDALPIALECDCFVFVEDEEGASVHVIDLAAEENEDRVRQAQVRELEAGMFLLLRTEGGGDFVVTIADRLLGSLAESYRVMQAEWKSRLRDEVHARGLAVVARALERRGCRTANPVNVHRWTSSSPRVIKTNALDDFEKILAYVGLDESVEDYWQAMRKVTSAHIRAGKLIRSQLLEQVAEADLSSLRRVGYATFELNEAQGGTLEAFRIVDISDQTESIPHTLLRHPIPGCGREEQILMPTRSLSTSLEERP